jgi:hypothetical protein
MHKDLRPIVKQLRKRGYTVAPTRGGHYGVYDSDNVLLHVLVGTPHGQRWQKNLKADLKRKGLLD